MNLTRGFLKSLLLAAALFCVSAVLRADPPDGYKFLRYDQGIAKAQQNKRKIFVYFGREGCGFCDVTNRKAFSLPEVRARYEKNYELVYVDAESGRRLRLPSGERITERDLGTHYKAFVTPVFIFLEADGNKIFQRVGIQTAEQLLSYDTFIQQEAYKKQPYEDYEKTKNKK